MSRAGLRAPGGGAARDGDGSLTVREAGQRGGRKVVAERGPAFFRRIAAAGRASWAASSTPEQRAAISRRGNAAQAAALGPEGMRAKAIKGGQALRDARGADYYRALGRLSHELGRRRP